MTELTPSERLDERGDEAPGSGLEEPVLVPPRGLVATLLIALVVIAAAAVLRPARVVRATRPSLELTYWQQGAVQELARRAERSKLAPKGAPSRRLYALTAVWLAQEATLGVVGVGRDPHARRTLAETEEEFRRFGLTQGRAALLQLAAAWSRQVRQTYERELPAGGPRLGALAPGMGPALQRAGVDRWRRGHALSPGAALVVEGLAETRFLQLARRLPGTPLTTSSPTTRALQRYRVEAHPRLSLRRRLELADKWSEQDAAWPRSYVTAVLLARAGRFRAAAAWFTRSARQGEQVALAKANARWCRAQLKLNQRSSERQKRP